MSELHPLEAYRTENGLSRSDLASKLDVSRMAVYRWETGSRRVDDDLLQAVSDRTGIPKRVLRPDLFELMAEVQAETGEAA